MPAEQRDEDQEIGALWERKTAKGEIMLTGNVNGVDIVCFLARRTTEKSPTYRVLKSRPRPDTPAPRNPRLPVGRDARDDPFDPDDPPF